MSLGILLISALAIAGLPLYLALSGVALAGFFKEGLQLEIYFAEFVRLGSNPILIAVPLFTLAGYILANTKAPQRLVRLSEALLHWLPGSLGVVTIVVMALLAAFTGASGITIVALGGLLLPTLIKRGFSEQFGVGLLTASGSIGLLFPPSLPILIYGVVAEAPIEKLFIAGLLPGLLMVGAMSTLTIFKGIKIGKTPSSDQIGLIQALREAIWEAPLPILVVGGIYGGLVTPGEAAVLMVAYLLIIELFVTKDIKINDLPVILIEAAVLVGEILLILGAAMALTDYLVFADIPTNLLHWIQGTIESKWAFLLALNAFLLLIGSLMEMYSALIVVIPLLLPLGIQYGVDPIHLAIIFLANLEVGFCLPPFGLNLFISSFRFRKPVLTVYRAVLPFLLIQIIILILITYVPALTMAPLAWFGER